MKNTRLNACIVAAALALGSTAVLASDDQPIDVNTDGLQAHVAEQVRERAAQGEQALMQYLWFNRRMHHLWLDDVTKPRAEAMARDEPREQHVAYVRTHGGGK